MSFNAKATDLLKTLPGPPSAKWPEGVPFALALAHGSMSVEIYAPVGEDRQTPHEQDELYFIRSGTATLVVEGQRTHCEPGTVHFVPGRAEHRFETFTADFTTWVVFWGPAGGESAA
ncbi:MAG: cupin domain-containing protein [Steroidobacteraceae bacterium]|mgnify:FL=1